MKRSFLFISCEEAKLICDKAQYGEASLWEKVKLNLRLSWCHVTKQYSMTNTALSQAIKQSSLNCLQKSERQKLEHAFKEELVKQQNGS